MLKQVEIRIPPNELDNVVLIEKKIKHKAGIKHDNIFYRLIRRSIDSRGATPVYVLRYEWSRQPLEEIEADGVVFDSISTVPKGAKEVHIIGAGPAGYFAALEALEHGLRPIVYERGKDVRARRRDLKDIQQKGIVNPDSNYCFGEGGAGTYSDGKLYTRSKKRGSVRNVLELLVSYGAKSDILIDAHPHIGSNKLPGIIANIREAIQKHGGEVRFESKVTNFRVEGNRIVGLQINEEIEVKSELVILATGHSARDIYQKLSDLNVLMHFKPFALGVRIEHAQSLIDGIQYGLDPRPDSLPASSYSLVHSEGEMGVYSFCMCPGGIVVPAATAGGEIVLNGMSLSRRDSAYANAGTVVSTNWSHVEKFEHKGALAGMFFQREVEQRMFNHGDGSQKAPTQRLVDFCMDKVSSNLPSTSYIPGNYSAPLHSLLPDYVVSHLKRAIPVFGKKMKGYYTNEAVLMATESRTSSPVRIPRHAETLEHTTIQGFYPCGEGAGYAGGIISAAIDGQRVVRAIAKTIAN